MVITQDVPGLFSRRFIGDSALLLRALLGSLDCLSDVFHLVFLTPRATLFCESEELMPSPGSAKTNLRHIKPGKIERQTKNNRCRQAAQCSYECRYADRAN